MRLKDVSRVALRNPSFLLTRGTDPFIIRLVVRRLKEVLGVPPTWISLRSTPIEEVLEAVHTGNLFSGRNLYIVEGLESVRKKRLEELLPSFRDIPAENHTIFLIENHNRIPPAMFKIGPLIRIEIDLEEDIVPLIKGYFESAAIRIDRRAIDFLIETYHDDLQSLEREVEKIRYYFWGKGVVDLDLLREILADNPRVSATDYAHHLLKGEKREALVQLQRLKDWEANFQLVVGTIAGYLLRSLAKDYAPAKSLKSLSRLARLDLVTKSRTQLPWHHLELFTIVN
ncbi:hypothetical protein DRP53_06280 [candidate division WOR-3 bacterium]|uniref:DNA polymerase III delta N-terminal domain-containing protein n=1 Tax=candidate division WOR-3 bacterium TaxID=2052148 RepID=A0A660SIW0_UNCW3|nr:MAG: hypothetical protein DRP53_06280 [candidate division WOR-3 bacterium]